MRAAIIGIALAILALAQRLGAYENKPLALLSAIIGAGLLAYAALSWVLHWRGSLTIHRSIYGSDFGGKDVTEQIRMHIKDGKVCEKIDSDLLGDPTPNLGSGNSRDLNDVTATRRAQVRVFSTFVIFGHNGIGHAEILLAIAEHRHGEAASAMAHHIDLSRDKMIKLFGA